MNHYVVHLKLIQCRTSSTLLFSHPVLSNSMGCSMPGLPKIHFKKRGRRNVESTSYVNRLISHRSSTNNDFKKKKDLFATCDIL